MDSITLAPAQFAQASGFPVWVLGLIALLGLCTVAVVAWFR